MDPTSQTQRSLTHQRAVAESIIWVTMCSGGALVHISAAERPSFVLGQLVILGVAILVSLFELVDRV